MACGRCWTHGCAGAGRPDRALVQAPWLSLYPGLAIFIAVLGLNLFGDGLRQLLDPRLRGRGQA